jgi:hypothetical protein
MEENSLVSCEVGISLVSNLLVELEQEGFLIPMIANLVLQDTVERIFVNDLYTDIQRGIFLVRGENVLLLGEIVCDSRLVLKKNLSNGGLNRIWIKMIIYLHPSKRHQQPKSIS